MRLSHRDFDLLQRAILELYEHRDSQTFMQAVSGIFLKVIPADYFALVYLRLDMAAQRMTTFEYVESSPRVNSDIVARMERFGGNHPFSRYSVRSKDPTAVKMSDFFTLSQFRNSALYQDFYRHLEIGRLLGAAIGNAGNMTTINVARQAREKDFTERDRLILNLLRPHFEQAFRNARLATARLDAGAKPLAAYELTPRESEIAHWVANGKTNPEIAIIVQASPRTVEKHMENILEKLGVENRTTAAVLIASGNCAH